MEARIRQLEAEAARLSLAEARQSIHKEIARLRVYADIKRWLAVPAAGRDADLKTRPPPAGSGTGSSGQA